MKKIGHMVENYIMVSHKNFRHKNINLHIPNMEMPTTENIANMLMLSNNKTKIPYHIQLCSATSNTADGLWQGLDWIIT